MYAHGFHKPSLSLFTSPPSVPQPCYRLDASSPLPPSLPPSVPLSLSPLYSLQRLPHASTFLFLWCPGVCRLAALRDVSRPYADVSWTHGVRMQAFGLGNGLTNTNVTMKIAQAVVQVWHLLKSNTSCPEIKREETTFPVQTAMRALTHENPSPLAPNNDNNPFGPLVS
eukprot:2198660-Rhodomonas_salina.1